MGLKWIPVTEALPTEYCDVLCFYIDADPEVGRECSGMAVTDADEEGVYPAYDLTIVTHWMPLPDPPKED